MFGSHEMRMGKEMQFAVDHPLSLPYMGCSLSLPLTELGGGLFSESGRAFCENSKSALS